MKTMHEKMPMERDGDRPPEHNPKPQPTAEAAMQRAHEIEMSQGGLMPLQKRIGTKAAFEK